MKRVVTATIGLLAFAAAPALAADLPVKAPPMAPAPVWNWSGLYIGVNGGYSWGRSSRDVNFFNPLNGVVIASGTGGGRDLNGGLFGGQLGYNWQTANWVFGIETDAQWTGQKGSTTVLCPVAGCFPTAVAAGTGVGASLSDKLEWFGTFRGRGGGPVRVHGGRHSGHRRRVEERRQIRLDGRRWHRDDVRQQLERQDRIPLHGSRLDQQFGGSPDRVRISSRCQRHQSCDGQHHPRRHQLSLLGRPGTGGRALLSDFQQHQA
jgi:opacity protein-like surface antigen